ncbi:SDR family oxidoreductase [Amycolatopsis jiangsuensis]|uniref:Citronellol/citronellal dehydrogenase n=1 Tax=Amycolatopsis jiangsuensis TaxID=1181879 RepID=A0A840J856_9PSEU|nr:NAD(P)-dependent oxidoreductase [Amycolatopsis jiangsuensis]MBB4689557.1 citronellol/citronellal dehydrogenase [Amycolatopsis jiangsuensis]
MSSLKDRTVFITGGSRGIGRAIALRAARDGANVVLAAKTAEPHPTLSGTIHTVAAEIEEAGGQALPLAVDVRDSDRVADAVAAAAERFGGIDVLVNNASAVFLGDVESTPVKRFDLVFDINVRGTFLVSQQCIPYLRHSDNPHIVTLSPPIDLSPGWFAGRTAYTMSKYAMSMTVAGLAAELADNGVAVNALWPRTMIYTAASAMFDIGAAGCRTEEIMADAAYEIVTSPAAKRSGEFLIDEDVLRASGVDDFSRYEVVPGAPIQVDLFVA